jgi:hypothetical protein
MISVIVIRIYMHLGWKLISYQKIWREDRILEVGGIGRYPKKCGFLEQRFVLLDKIVDHVLCSDMWDFPFPAGQFFTIGKSAPDIVLQSGCLGSSSGEILALHHLNLNSLLIAMSNEWLKKIRHCENGVGALEFGIKRCYIA